MDNLDQKAIQKMIEDLTVMIINLELAKSMTTDEQEKIKLGSAAGQIKAARTWLIKLRRK